MSWPNGPSPTFKNPRPRRLGNRRISRRSIPRPRPPCCSSAVSTAPAYTPLLAIMRLFGGTFKNFVFLEIGQLDVGSFKGPQEVEHLHAQVLNDLNRYVNLMGREGFYAEPVCRYRRRCRRADHADRSDYHQEVSRRRVLRGQAAVPERVPHQPAAAQPACLHDPKKAAPPGHPLRDPADLRVAFRLADGVHICLVRWRPLVGWVLNSRVLRPRRVYAWVENPPYESEGASAFCCGSLVGGAGVEEVEGGGVDGAQDDAHQVPGHDQAHHLGGGLGHEVPVALGHALVQE